MKGAVVYHSRWGNCRQVAEAIAKGLKEKGQEVAVLDAKEKEYPGEEVDFLVVGSPTRGGTMSSPIKKFIDERVTSAWQGKPFAAFGTGARKWLDRDGQSKDAIYQALVDAGLKPLAPAFQGIVEKMKGPLAEGNLDEAYRYGVSLAEALAQG